MSEQVRMVLIVLFFVLGGALLWNFQFRDSADAPETRVTNTPSENTASRTVKVDAQYPDEPASSEAQTAATIPDSTPTSAARTTASGPSGKGSITGEIVVLDGSPIPVDLNVALHYVPDEARYDPSVDTVHAKLETQGNAEFEFADLPLGRYVLIGQSDTYTGVDHVTIREDRLESSSRMTLYPAATISGTVVNTVGEVVQDATVFMSGFLSGGADQDAGLYRSRTTASPVDETGAFTVHTLQVREPALQYRLVAIAPDYAPQRTELLPTGSTDVQIILGQGVSISGTMINRDTNKPVVNQPFIVGKNGVSLATQNVTTDKDGAFAVTDLLSGTINFSMDPGPTILMPDSRTLELGEDESVDDLQLNVRAGGLVTGRMYDEETGKGVPEAYVYAQGRNGARVAGQSYRISDANGRFKFEGLSAGNYEFYYRNTKGYASSRSWDDRQKIQVELGGTYPNIDFPLRKGLYITGVILDPDGNPLKNVSVSGESNETSKFAYQQSEKDGTFGLYGYEPNSIVKVRIQEEAYAFPPQDIKIAERPVTGLTLRVSTGASVSGIVVDSAGSPASGIRVYAKHAAENWQYSNQTSNAKGEVTLKGLVAGNYEIRNQVKQYQYGRNDPVLDNITIGAGQMITGKRFVLEKRSERNLSISGIITDDTGRPLTGARATMTDEYGNDSNSAISNQEGHYKLQNISEGSYRIVFRAPKHVAVSKQKIEAGASNTDVVLARKGSVAGRVLKPDGQPLEDFGLAFYSSPNVDNPSGHKRFHNEDGEFTLEDGYPDRTNYVFARAEGYADIVVPVEGMRSGETVYNIIVQMEASNSLTGTVVDTQGNPISKAQIFRGDTGYDAYNRRDRMIASTDRDGRFKIADLPLGSFRVSAFKEGFTPAGATAEISGLTNSVRLVLGNGGTLLGVVTENGEPVVKASVYGTIQAGRRKRHQVRAKTDANGRFTVSGIPMGSGQVSANIQRDNKSRRMSKEVSVADEMETVVDFDFVPASSTVEGYVMKNESEPMASYVNISVNTGTAKESRSAETGADGYFVFNELPAGSIRLTSHIEEQGRQKVVVGNVGENETVRLDMKLYGGTTLYTYVENAPARFRLNGYILPGSVNVPTPLPIDDAQAIFNEPLMQTNFINEAATFRELEKGTYTLLVIAFPSSQEDYENLTYYPTAHATITIGDEVEKDVTVSF